MNLPNILTLLRIALLPFFLFFLVGGNYGAALIVFLIASISDALDGFIARKFHQITEFGKFLDPAADKLFLLSTFITFYLLDLIPLWFFIIGLAKDMVILSGSAVIYLKNVKFNIEPTFSGKVSTALQMATVLLILFHGMNYITREILLAAMIATASILFYSTLSYVIIGIRIYKGGHRIE
ncbi:MAG: CDP-diacylglycerol--glycerol-3-phosphate 3-phosphatidyltransferase [bacterium]|nr:CDP-diacylglycerol--glycerol-3-phosphate 3-phosphatidyltransferase [bacterium]